MKPKVCTHCKGTGKMNVKGKEVACEYCKATAKKGKKPAKSAGAKSPPPFFAK